jgi:hypothetical protein
LTETRERLAGLSPDRLALLQQRLRERASARTAPQEIRRREADGPAPLSFAQQRLWFIDQLEPGTPTYNMVYTVRLCGPLDAAALRGAFSAVSRTYAPLSRFLPADQPLYALQSRGMAADAPPLETVEEIADEYLRHVRGVQPEGPYRLGGWSMGGVVAFEMARRARGVAAAAGLRVRRRRRRPRGAGTAPRLRPASGPPGGAARRLGRGDRRRWAGGAAGAPSGSGRDEGAVLPDLGVGHLRRFYGVYRANALALRRYRPGAYVGRAVLLHGSEAGEPSVRPLRGGSGTWPGGWRCAPFPAATLACSASRTSPRPRTRSRRP